jgi:hypothetical protein
VASLHVHLLDSPIFLRLALHRVRREMRPSLELLLF